MHVQNVMLLSKSAELLSAMQLNYHSKNLYKYSLIQNSILHNDGTIYFVKEHLQCTRDPSTLYGSFTV